jgi:hypothetical protein
MVPLNKQTYVRFTGPAVAFGSTGLSVKNLLFADADCHIFKMLQSTAVVSLYRPVLVLETEWV